MSGSTSERRANKHNSKHSDNKNRTKNIEKKAAKSRGFPWITGCFVLFIAICGAAIAYDVQTSSSYQKSHTARATKVALEIGDYALSTSLATSARGFLWLERNAPDYYAAVADFSKPYAILTYDMALIISNQAREIYGNVKEYIVEKWPLFYLSIDQYAPGVLDSISEYSCNAWNATKNFTIQYYEIAVAYLKTKIFVDNWAPEVLQAKTLAALNTTRLYAAEYYKRFHQQVDHYSKL